jgi:hypothetical protein
MYYSGNGNYQDWINLLENFIPETGTISDNNNVNYFLNKEQINVLEDLRIYANIYYHYFKYGYNKVKKLYNVTVNNQDLDSGIDSLVLSIIDIFPNIDNLRLILYLMDFEINNRANNNPKYHAYQQVIKNIWVFDSIITINNYKLIKGVGPSIGTIIYNYLHQ